jgi:MFS family permease
MGFSATDDVDDEAASHARRRRLRLLAYLIGAFGLSLSAQINFLVPLRARELGAGLDVIGLIIGSGTLAAALSSVTIGAVIDRIGPKRAFVLGAAGTAAASLGFVLIDSYWWFVALQPVHGVVRNLGWVASQGYITSFAADEERARLAGRFSFFSNVGTMVGPLLAGTAASVLGFRWALMVPVLYSVAFALIGLALAETRDPQDIATDVSGGRGKSGNSIGAAVGLLANKGIQVALILSFSRLWTSHVYAAFLPVFMVDNGISADTAGVVMATSGLVAAVMAPTTGFWTRFMTPQAAATLGLGCNAVGLILAPHLDSVPAIFLVPVLVGIGVGLSLPLLITIVTTVVPVQQRGLALGLRAFVNQVAATAAPVIIGPLMTLLGLTLGFTAGGATALVLLTSSRVLHIRNRRQAAAGAGAATSDAQTSSEEPGSEVR